MFEILRATKVNKGTLKFSVDICIPKWGNFCIHGIQIFEKNDQRWVTFPAKKIELPSGETRYLPYNRFKDRGVQDVFGHKIYESLEAWIKSGGVLTTFEEKVKPPEFPKPAFGPGSGDSYSEVPF